MPRVYVRESPRERIERLIEPDLNSGCWLWSGYVNELGYGSASFGTKGSAVFVTILAFLPLLIGYWVGFVSDRDKSLPMVRRKEHKPDRHQRRAGPSRQPPHEGVLAALEKTEGAARKPRP